MKRGAPHKPGSIGEQRERLSSWSNRDRSYPPNKPKECPYNGLMAAGWIAFHAGKPNVYTKPPTRGTKAWAWYQGYTKAKLAKEQGKRAI